MLNQYKTLLVVFAMISTSVSYASSVRLSTEFVTADGLWIGDEEVDFEDANGDTGTRTITQYELSSNYSLGENDNLMFSLSYNEASMNDIGFADVGADQARRGIGTVGAAYTKMVYSGAVDITAGAGFRAPGDNRSGDTFIALSDGLMKYDGHLNFGKNFGRVNVFLNNRYTLRPEASNQLLNTFGVSGSAIPSKLYLGASFSMFDTLGGGDIAGVGFTNTGAPGFSRVQEKFTSTYLSATYLHNHMAYDISLSQKLSGENTDMSKSFGFGVTKYY